MIQANELRVWNKVWVEDEFLHMTTEGTVRSIETNGDLTVNGDLIYMVSMIDQWGNLQTENIIDLEGIPLTHTILEDCGFEGEQLKLKLTRTKFLEWSYGTDFWLCNEDGDELYEFENIPSLHCLQNLIHSLTGKEIEYKPKK